MSNGKLFIAYHYTGRYGNELSQGFENMVGHKLIWPPQDEGHIEELENICADHCREKIGFESVVVTIINWKWMDGKS